jgi:hypothetical protein
MNASGCPGDFLGAAGLGQASRSVKNGSFDPNGTRATRQRADRQVSHSLDASPPEDTESTEVSNNRPGLPTITHFGGLDASARVLKQGSG